MKTCGKCQKPKSASEFSRRGKKRTDLKSRCRECISSESRGGNYNIKIAALEHYGKVCRCCGVSEPDFLALDHVNNDGAESRRRLKHGTGNNFYKWLKRNNYPDLGLQVLCHNCNMGKQIRGVCPHAIERDEHDPLDPKIKT